MGRAGTFWLAAWAAALALAGCGGSSTTTIKDTVTKVSTRSVPTPAPKIPCDSKRMLASAPTGTCSGGGRVFHYAVNGSTLELDTVSVTVQSVKEAVNFTFNGNGYGAPPGGGEFVRVVLALTNRVNIPAEIDQYAGEVGLVTNAGNVPALPENNDPMDFTKAKLLNPGATFTGALSFELTRQQAAAFKALGGLLEIGNFGQQIQGNDFKHPRGLIFIKAA